jgi:putative ABC transport system ATP-binding protein
MIELRSVGRRFGSRTVLEGIDLSVDEGQQVALRGKSGSGKTTLLNVIGGLDSAYTGELRIGGQHLRDLGERAVARYRANTVAFVFQRANLIGRMSVLDNVLLGGLFKDRSERGPAGNRGRALEAIDSVGLRPFAGVEARLLSGGEAQRAALARALFSEARILLCDEPTANLDDESAAPVVEILNALGRERGLTVIIATHDRSLSETADRRLVLRAGRLSEETAVPR